MYIEKNQKLYSELHDLTLCRQGELKDADYIFLSSEMNYASMEEIMKNVKKGTYEDPQDSATIFILCDKLKGNTPMVIKGPGVKNTLTVNVDQYIKTIVSIRQELRIEYPLGVDLVFVDPDGEIMCIPRLCKIVYETGR